MIVTTTPERIPSHALQDRKPADVAAGAVENAASDTPLASSLLESAARIHTAVHFAPDHFDEELPFSRQAVSGFPDQARHIIEVAAAQPDVRQRVAKDLAPRAFCLPWQQPCLRNWSIVGMNHYRQNGKRHLFVSMARDGRCITAEGVDEARVWDDLAEQARTISANDPKDTL